jgi:hypothetical protein
MESEAITQIKQLLGRAEQLRKTLSNAERLQLMGLTETFSNELQRPDEAVFRITFNQACFSPCTSRHDNTALCMDSVPLLTSALARSLPGHPPRDTMGRIRIPRRRWRSRKDKYAAC